ncbi:UNVERIFIED_CONTAM: hypothetical protein Sradi_5260600 [Sesamum radiatum]|uniref:Uncharacterized protein n=1 Tax=Sesamum radiatum TaxID=300843 RepID=A0AAW2LQK7_SESRA
MNKKSIYDATCDLIGAPLREVLSVLAMHEPHEFVLEKAPHKEGGLSPAGPIARYCPLWLLYEPHGFVQWRRARERRTWSLLAIQAPRLQPMWDACLHHSPPDEGLG